MPYRTEWVDPEVFLIHGDVTVYHLYHGDDFFAGAKTFWFSTSSKGSEEGAGANGEFDVRTLPAWPKEGMEDWDVWTWAEDAIRDAIDQGILPVKEDS